MLTILYRLLVLSVGWCTAEQLYEKKTIHVGDDVNLTCARRAMGSLFWIRLVSGNFPEIVAKTYTLETIDPRITATKEPGTFVLRITRVKLSDAAVYICLQTHQQSLSLLKETDLRVEAPQPDITAAPPCDPVCPGDSVTLQCSSPESENKTCPCYRVESHQSHPSFNCSQGNAWNESEKNPVRSSTKKCVFCFFENMICSDAVTYHCSLATCGDITSENRSKLNNEVDTAWDSHSNNTILFLWSVLGVSLIVIGFSIYSLKTLDFCSGTAASYGQQKDYLLQDQDIWTNSTVVFTMVKTSSKRTR